MKRLKQLLIGVEGVATTIGHLENEFVITAPDLDSMALLFDYMEMPFDAEKCGTVQIKKVTKK